MIFDIPSMIFDTRVWFLIFYNVMSMIFDKRVWFLINHSSDEYDFRYHQKSYSWLKKVSEIILSLLSMILDMDGDAMSMIFDDDEEAMSMISDRWVWFWIRYEYDSRWNLSYETIVFYSIFFDFWISRVWFLIFHKLMSIIFDKIRVWFLVIYKK